MAEPLTLIHQRDYRPGERVLLPDGSLRVAEVVRTYEVRTNERERPIETILEVKDDEGNHYTLWLKETVPA
ncbi:MAG: hypothetical protein M3518_06470 [Actinomycetota bacterium]|nr:hypothetical protein [Actinomycetota bacterium]